ncbi:MAG: hypothetical protein ACR2L2_11715 [Acidobacteriota bacterium]
MHKSVKSLFWVALTLCCTSLALGQQPTSPEEPDFAFITGGPFTQGKKVPQFISAFNYGRFKGPSKRFFSDNWSRTLRIEWGFTDKLEGDFIFGNYESVTRSSAGRFGERGWDDTVAGIRYRLLNEEDHPFTLTLGPQVIAPTSAGSDWTYAVDIASAKDWGGPVFIFTSLNYRVTPGVERLTSSSAESTFHGLNWASALGLRLLEQKRANGSLQDIHGFLELGGEVEQEFESPLLSSKKDSRHAVLFAPGIRWGFMTPRKNLFELGISFPLGLNRHAADWGIIAQLQIEIPVPD